MKPDPARELDQLLREIRACRLCEAHLPLGPRPVLAASASARLLIVSQAPGARVHATGIPWNDASGRRLREWLKVDEATFYDPQRVAIVPMGFCYPGRAGSGDAPPRPECRATWHPRLLPLLSKVEFTLSSGQYAQGWCLGARR
jgi:uracil-DNA glycosylase